MREDESPKGNDETEHGQERHGAASHLADVQLATPLQLRCEDEQSKRQNRWNPTPRHQAADALVKRLASGNRHAAGAEPPRALIVAALLAEKMAAPRADLAGRRSVDGANGHVRRARGFALKRWSNIIHER